MGNVAAKISDERRVIQIINQMFQVREHLDQLSTFPSVTKGDSDGQTVFNRIDMVENKVGDCITELYEALKYYNGEEVDDVGLSDF